MLYYTFIYLGITNKCLIKCKTSNTSVFNDIIRNAYKDKYTSSMCDNFLIGFFMFSSYLFTIGFGNYNYYAVLANFNNFSPDDYS